MQSTSWESLGWKKHRLNQDCQEKYQQTQICRWYHYNGRQLRGTKEPLDEAERGEWKAGLKLNTQKMKIMASSPITSWQIDGAEVESVTIWGSKITADGDCSHEIKRCLLLGRKVMTNLDSILKNRHHFTDKCPYSQNYGFSSSHVWMWELDHKEGWATKNFCFKLWY